MKRRYNSLLIILLVGLISTNFITCKPAEKVARESVLDGVVHLEKELITEIPQVNRLCDELDLEEHRINVGDGELYCDEEGKGMPIVLLHGGPGATHHYFHPHFSKAKKFARIIYYDQRGCGISDYERGEGYSVDQAADDLENLRKALNIDKWVVLGHSYGGLLAQYYTMKYPESLAGLILVGSSLGMQVQLQRTRQYDYISKEERERMGEIRKEIGELIKEKKITNEQVVELIVFNNHINGDWKRQNYYRPSIEDHARMAFYEWKHGPRFRGDMGQSIRKIDLEGAFEQCPIPTMIMEGNWDLTWNTDKREILHKNHPGSRLVMFEHSSHNPFQDEPKLFFKELKGFVKSLPEIIESDISPWKNYLVSWKKEMEKKPAYILRSADYGRYANEKVAGLYSEEWLVQLDNIGFVQKAGFALYDVKRYEEALTIFKKMYELAQKKENKFYSAVALIWQGHMLDLLGKRKEAIAIYEKAANLNVKGRLQHDQFGLKYSPSPYAVQRMKEPFKRLENRQK